MRLGIFITLILAAVVRAQDTGSGDEDLTDEVTTLPPKKTTGADYPLSMCWSYNSESECLADSCYWSTQYNFCAESRPCWTAPSSEECSSVAGCAWHTTFQSCIMSSFAEAPTAATVGPASQAAACWGYTSKESCTSNACFWADGYNYCSEIQVCWTFTTNTDCVAAGGCVWDTSYNFCGNKPASDGSTGTGTGTGTSSDAGGSSSAPTEAPTISTAPGCWTYTSQSKCLENSCFWAAGYNYCSQTQVCWTFNNTDDCTSTAECQWNSDFNFCTNVPSSPATVATVAPTVSPTSAGCWVYTTQPTCTANNCFWNSGTSHCSDVLSCSIFTTSTDCSATPGCLWNADFSTCYNAPAVAPSSDSTPGTPATVASSVAGCWGFTSQAACVASNCYWATGYNYCSQTQVCWTFSTAENCTAAPECSWNGDFNFCYNTPSDTTAATPVSSAPVAATAFSCSNIALSTSCIANNCFWNSELNSCSDTPNCHSFTLPADCTANSGCLWSSDSSSCVVKVAPKPSVESSSSTASTAAPCISHDNASKCNSSNCYWSPDYSFCSDEPVCWTFSQSAGCIASRDCAWNAETNNCFSTLATVAPTAASASTAPVLPSAAVNCFELLTKAECGAKNCYWSPDYSFCSNTPVCWTFSQSVGCSGSRDCVWVAATNECRITWETPAPTTSTSTTTFHPSSCFSLTSQSSCSEHNCYWSIDYSFCAAEPICWTVSTQSRCAESRDCKWDTASSACITSISTAATTAPPTESTVVQPYTGTTPTAPRVTTPHVTTNPCYSYCINTPDFTASYCVQSFQNIYFSSFVEDCWTTMSELVGSSVSASDTCLACISIAPTSLNPSTGKGSLSSVGLSTGSVVAICVAATLSVFLVAFFVTRVRSGSQTTRVHNLSPTPSTSKLLSRHTSAAAISINVQPWPEAIEV